MGYWTTIEWYEDDIGSPLWGYAETGKYSIPHLTLLLAGAEGATFLHHQTGDSEIDFSFRVKVSLDSVSLLVENIYSTSLRLLRTPLNEFQQSLRLEGDNSNDAIRPLVRTLEYLRFFYEYREADSFFGLLMLCRSLSKRDPSPGHLIIDASDVQTMYLDRDDPELREYSNRLEIETGVIKELASALVAIDARRMRRAISKIESTAIISQFSLGNPIDWVFESNAWMDRSTVGWSLVPESTQVQLAEEADDVLNPQVEFDCADSITADFLKLRNECLEW